MLYSSIPPLERCKSDHGKLGESGSFVVVPGTGAVKDIFEERGMTFSHNDEVITASYYSVDLNSEDGGKIFAEQSAST